MQNKEEVFVLYNSTQSIDMADESESSPRLDNI
jgi:hypothetical protein